MQFTARIRFLLPNYNFKKRSVNKNTVHVLPNKSLYFISIISSNFNLYLSISRTEKMFLCKNIVAIEVPTFIGIWANFSGFVYLIFARKIRHLCQKICVLVNASPHPMIKKCLDFEHFICWQCPPGMDKFLEFFYEKYCLLLFGQRPNNLTIARKRCLPKS